MISTRPNSSVAGFDACWIPNNTSEMPNNPKKPEMKLFRQGNVWPMPMAFLKILYTSIDCKISKGKSMRMTPFTRVGNMMPPSTTVALWHIGNSAPSFYTQVSADTGCKAPFTTKYLIQDVKSPNYTHDHGEIVKEIYMLWWVWNSFFSIAYLRL